MGAQSHADQVMMMRMSSSFMFTGVAALPLANIETTLVYVLVLQRDDTSLTNVLCYINMRVE